MRLLVSKLAKSGGRVAGLVVGALPDLKLFFGQLLFIRSPIWTFGTRIGVSTLGSRTTPLIDFFSITNYPLLKSLNTLPFISISIYAGSRMNSITDILTVAVRIYTTQCDCEQLIILWVGENCEFEFLKRFI